MKLSHRYAVMGITIVLASGGLLGYVLWRSKHISQEPHHTPVQSASQSSNSAQGATPAKAATPEPPRPTPPPADTATYVRIREWGIKVKLTDADKLSYTVHGSPGGSPNADSTTSYAQLRLKDSVGTTEACKPLGASLAQLTAATSGTKIGTYYYGLEGSLNTCGDKNADAIKTRIFTEAQAPGAIVAD